MSTTKHVLAAGTFFQDWSNIGLITANDDWSAVPSIVGYLGQDITTSTGTNPQNLQTSSALAADVDVIANQTNTGITNGGVAEFHISDPVVGLQGSGTADAPHLVVYLDATGRENIVFSYRARDLDATADNAIMQVAVQYRVGGTGPWIDVPAGYISDATAGPSANGPDTIRTVTLPAGANGAASLEVRVITTNAAGNDEWVGIDDITVTSDAIPPGPGILAINDAAVFEGNGPGMSLGQFTVTRSNGADGAITVDYTITFTGTAPASAGDFGPSQAFTGTISWAAGEAAPKTIDIFAQGDVTVEPNETFTVTLSNATGGASISDATGAGTITNDDSGPVAIYDIQGATHTSPWSGATVTTSGIVTAVDSNGYYLQDASGDGNDSTSDGIFVFTSGAPTVDVGGTPQPIQVGDSLTVTGTVTEFQANSASLTVTELTGTTAVRNSQGNALPAAVLIGTGGRTPPTENYEDDNFTSFNPATDALDFYESMEGMRVTIQAPLVVANSNSFGETHVVASGGAGATGINARKGITVSEGDFNPERIQIDDDANLTPAGYTANHSQGDVLGDVTGILNYAFSNYEVLVTAPVTVTTDVTLGQETTALDGTADRLTVASYNVENLDPTDPQSKYDAIASQIVNNLSAPDIIGLQEIQDADGAGTGTNYSGQATADKLIAAIAAAGGPTYQYVEIAPTSNSTNNGEPNGNIRTAFLYNPERVTYVPGSAEIVPGAAASGVRYPLAADFLFNGETVTVINVHFTSRGGSEPLMGDSQPPANGGDAARLAQAQAVRAYIDGLAAGDPELNIVTLGDFNSFYFEAPLQAIQAGGAQNNLHLLLPEEERYTYMFEGNLQALDNILVGPNLNLTSQFDAVHLNAEQPSGSAKPTDHDPTIAQILISANDLISSTSGNDVRRSGAGNDVFLLTEGGNDTASGGSGSDGFIFRGTMTSQDAVDGGDDRDQIVIQGNYIGANALTLGAGVVNVESFVLIPGNDTRRGDPGTGSYSYSVTTVDENVAAGQTMTFDGAQLRAGENFTFRGGAELDGAFRVVGGLGTDDFVGGSQSDVFRFNDGAFGSSDVVDGGAGTARDQLSLRGDYTLFFGAGQITSIESLVLLSGHDFALDTDYDYFIATNDNNLAAGQTMTIDAGQLREDESFVFFGNNELDGFFRISGGAGSDQIIAGQNADRIRGNAGSDNLYGREGGDEITGGAGDDRFAYDAISHSTAAAPDKITDFTTGDNIALNTIDANSNTPDQEDAFQFIGSAAFTGAAGQLRAYEVEGQPGRWFVEGDVDGDAQADLVIEVYTTDLQPLDATDFTL